MKNLILVLILVLVSLFANATALDINICGNVVEVVNMETNTRNTLRIESVKKGFLLVNGRVYAGTVIITKRGDRIIKFSNGSGLILTITGKVLKIK